MEETTGITINGEVTINIYSTENENKTQKHIKKIRTNTAVNTAKKKVKNRDGCCQCCGEYANGHLEVHHILPIYKYPDLASDEGNLISLCQKCHQKYHSMYNNDDTNAVSFSKFLKDYGNRIY